MQRNGTTPFATVSVFNTGEALQIVIDLSKKIIISNTGAKGGTDASDKHGEIDGNILNNNQIINALFIVEMHLAIQS